MAGDDSRNCGLHGLQPGVQGSIGVIEAPDKRARVFDPRVLPASVYAGNRP